MGTGDGFFFCLFVCLSGMRYQAKLLTLLSPQIDSKKSYLSILVNDEFYYSTIINAMIFFSILLLLSLFLTLFHFI